MCYLYWFSTNGTLFCAIRDEFNWNNLGIIFKTVIFYFIPKELLHMMLYRFCCFSLRMEYIKYFIHHSFLHLNQNMIYTLKDVCKVTTEFVWGFQSKLRIRMTWRTLPDKFPPFVLCRPSKVNFLFSALQT